MTWGAWALVPALASVLAAALASAEPGGLPGASPRGATGIHEWIDPAYNAFLPPGGLVALDPAGDRFEVEIARRDPSAALRQVHLALTVRRGDRVLARFDGASPVMAGQRAVVRVESPVSAWQILWSGRLTGVLSGWTYDGFDLLAEVREGDGVGPLIYRHHDPNRTLSISRRGFFARHGLALSLAGFGLALLTSLGSAWRMRRLSRPVRRGALRFDAFVLAALAAVAFAFSPYLLLGAWLAALVLPVIPQRLKQSVAGPVPLAGLPVETGAPSMRVVAAWSPAVATVMLTAWLLAWHHSLLVAMGFWPPDFREFLKLLSALYLAGSLVVVTLVHWGLARRALAGRPLWPVLVPAALVAALGVAARGVDWGTFYFSAGHVDEDFWAHAFYGQVLTMAADESMRGVALGTAASAGLVAVLLWRASVFARWARGRPDRQRPPAARALGRVFRANAAAAVLVVVIAEWTWPLLVPASGRDISDSIREAFAGVPEVKAASSLVRTLWPRSSGSLPPLDPAFIGKLSQAGLRLGASDPAWPLLKPSIYLDPAAAARADRPRVPAGTNVIVILGESLSSALVDDSVHGVVGLTPAIDDFRRRAYTFRNLYSADFPTIKGEFAALASFAFDHRGLPITADTGNPLKSRYLFLSDVLHERAGYSAYHLQSDYASFAGTASILARHSYERVYSAEDEEMRRRARHPLVKTWGLYDEDLFRSMADLMDEGAFREPFLLTVATTDLHFPYATLHRHPGTHGNALLDAVHSEDVAFAAFWDRFTSSRWARNTIVLLTADHALVRRVVRRGGADPRRSEFDYLLAAVYVPGDPRWAGGGTDTTCTQLDLVPTLLDMLGIDTPNPFLGLSIFTERPRYPLALAREIPSERWTAAERAAVQAIGWSEDDHQRWLDLLRALAINNRVWPPGRTGGPAAKARESAEAAATEIEPPARARPRSR